MEGLGESGVGEAHEDDVGAVVGGPHHTGDDVGVGAGAVGSQHRDGHDAHTGVADRGDADAVAGLGAGDAGEGCAVAVRVGHRVGSFDDGCAGDDVGG